MYTQAANNVFWGIEESSVCLFDRLTMFHWSATPPKQMNQY